MSTSPRSLHKNETGLGYLVLVVLAVIVVALVAIVAWRVGDNNKGKSNSVSNSSSATAKSQSTSSYSSCMTSYNDSKLCSFASNSLTLDKMAYTATITVKQNGVSGTLTLKNDGKGNTELMSSGTSQAIDVISLNKVEYVQSNGSGPWVQYPNGSGVPANNPASSMNVSVGRSGVVFKYLGTASCGNLSCYKYQVTDSASKGTTQYVWFDNNSYKLREWQAVDGSGNSTDMIINYGAVVISKPSPVESLKQAG